MSLKYFLSKRKTDITDGLSSRACYGLARILVWFAMHLEVELSKESVIWMDCTGIMKYLSLLNILTWHMAVYLGGSTTTESLCFTHLDQALMFSSWQLKLERAWDLIPLDLIMRGDEVDLAACLNAAVQVQIDGGVSVRECRRGKWEGKENGIYTVKMLKWDITVLQMSHAQC